MSARGPEAEALAEVDPYVIGERRLMLAIVLEALNDAAGTPRAATRAAEKEVHKQRARSWFEAGGEDFRLVCQMAGLEPSRFQADALAFIASGKPMPGKRIIMPVKRAEAA